MTRLLGALPGVPVIRFLKRLLFSLVPLLLLLVLLELLLWGLGLGKSAELSLSRGFDPRALYLAPAEDGSGAWTTRIYGETREELVIPPRGERLRVLLLGGSNTQGFPAWLLEELLNADGHEPGYEVVNLGRSGYGSERVAILLDQALPALRPDLVVIYTGHNEFRENAFADELLDAWSSPALKSITDSLQGLRTVTLVSDMLRPSAPTGVAETPEDRQRRRDQSYEHHTWEQTQLYWAAYEHNLRRMVAATREAGAEVLISTVVSNFLTPPAGTRLAPALGEERRSQVASLVRRAGGLLPEEIWERLPLGNNTRPTDWGMNLRSATEAERVQLAEQNGIPQPPTLRPLLGALADPPATAGMLAESIAGAHWTDPRLWVDSVKSVVSAIDALHRRDFDDAQRGRIGKAIEVLEEADALAPHEPLVLFPLGIARLLSGDDDALAVTTLREAMRYDRSPRHGTDLSNEIVERIAADLEVPLFDAALTFEERSPNRLIGYEIMLDTCHLHPGARVVLMQDLKHAIDALGVRRDD